MSLAADAAFAALKRLIAKQGDGDWAAPAAPAFDRLRRAWMAPDLRTHAELAVLLRQALLHETQRREGLAASLVLPPGSPLQGFTQWAESGLRADPLDGGWLVHAEPWRPDWAATAPDGLDGYAAGESPRRFADGAIVARDPCLAALDYPAYQSVGQRAAVRSALTTPPGGSLAVGLATGEGKSLLFQLVAKVGFATSGDTAAPGLTVVVTPTVALAIDHENSAIEKGFTAPIAYRGGEASSNATLVAGIEAGTQSLCIASPEALCGPLRGPLARAARRGEFRALVVDEAHLIDSWGTGFRTEFQSLSGARREWIHLAPPGQELRTLLLSATLPPLTLAMLKTLFAGPGPFESISALRLRSEPDYWAQVCETEAIRQTRVLEAIRRAPRPAILYVTRVADAEAWRARLIDAGFLHVAMVHGETPGHERDSILKGWRAGAIDLVVATSAFGLGIDYRHVRSVVHACIPESLDRFYQEVGRGGRDGRTCLSLALYTPGDEHVARRISRALVISLERGLQRWSSMYERRSPAAEPGAYVLPLDVAPSQAAEDIDMRGERNSDWNARVLALLARSGLVELHGAPPRDETWQGPHEIVRVLNPGHLRPETWRKKVEPVRRALASASDTSLDLMMRFLSATTCPAPLLLGLYGAGPDAHACSRCALCRVDPSAKRPERPRLEPPPPWRRWWPLGERISALLDRSGRLLVWYEPDELPTLSRRFRALLLDLRREGVLNVALVRAPEPFGADVDRALGDQAAFVTCVERLTQRRLPAGPHLAMLGPSAAVELLDLQPRADGEAQILLVPSGLRDPARPDGLLSATYGGKTLSFESFYARLHA